MHYADLSNYSRVSLNVYEHLKFSYITVKDKVLNIGWLGAGFEFPKGQVEKSIVDFLKYLCLFPVNVMRGCHFCEFCDHEDPPRILVEGSSIGLGGAEIWVPGKPGLVYAAPNLIIHYIQEHEYCPPDEFLEAVSNYSKAIGANF
jgi:hypothetical protein